MLHLHVSRAAAAQPTATALSMGDDQLTYGEVEWLSDGLARMLQDHNVGAGDRVGLLVPKEPVAVVAMQAVLKVGAVYVPLDTESPPPRLARIVRAADPAVVLAVPESGERLAALGQALHLPLVGSLGAPIVGADGEFFSRFSRLDWEDMDPAPGGWPTCRPDDLAHLLFTSGSTGEPKGVAITHANVQAFLDWAVAEFDIGPSDRLSGHPPLHFDLSTFDIYGTFMAGAQLHLVPPALGLSPQGLAAFIRDRELTQWFSVPSLLTYLVRFGAFGEGDFPALRRLLWCGEVLPTPVLAELMRRLPHVRFTNLYGPTEATIASSHYTVPGVPADERHPVPIGEACKGEELLVLDAAARPVPTGQVGDLYIGGVGLSPGYWRDADLTAAAFLPDPRVSGERIYRTGDLARVDEDGMVHFLGRADTQVKSRGYRIELGEVEAALHAVAGIRECAVVGVDVGGFEGTSICAAYVGDRGRESGPEPAVVKARLAELLPTYMLPAQWMMLDGLPKNQNDKVDRPELRRRFAAQSGAGTRVVSGRASVGGEV